MVQRFRTKIVEIEALQFTGTNHQPLWLWTGQKFGQLPQGRAHAVGYEPDITAEVFDVLHQSWIGVKSGQWIVKGVKGEFYPCDDETFHWKYEEIT